MVGAKYIVTFSVSFVIIAFSLIALLIHPLVSLYRLVDGTIQESQPQQIVSHPINVRQDTYYIQMADKLFDVPPPTMDPIEQN